MAQGSLIVSGFGVSGKDGSRIALNVPSGGRIPNGATVERAVPTQLRQRALRDAEPQHARLHHGDAPRGRHQCAARRRHRDADGRGVGAGGGARRSGPAHRLRRDARERDGRAGQRTGARDRQFPHRHGGDRLQRPGHAGGRLARLAVGDDHRAHRRQPAERARRGQHRRGAALGSQRRAGRRRACSSSTPASASTSWCRP